MTPEILSALRELVALQELATGGPWERGGPYPGTSVIVCVDGGCGWPNPEPPYYEPICILDQRQEGETSSRAQADADFIAAARNINFAALLAAVEQTQATAAPPQKGE